MIKIYGSVVSNHQPIYRFLHLVYHLHVGVRNLPPETDQGTHYSTVQVAKTVSYPSDVELDLTNASAVGAEWSIVVKRLKTGPHCKNKKVALTNLGYLSCIFITKQCAYKQIN